MPKYRSEDHDNYTDPPDIEEGELVRYMPDHAESPEHRDSVVGEVTHVTEEGVMVDYNDDSPNAKFTHYRNLIRLGDTGSYKQKDPYGKD